MSALDDERTDFENRARAVLERSVTATDARVRSRLNRARYAAVEQAGARTAPSGWRGWVPAGAVAAAVLATFVAWQQLAPRSGAPAPVGEQQNAVEVLDLVADNEAMELAGSAPDYAFYEWAAEQGSAGAET